MFTFGNSYRIDFLVGIPWERMQALPREVRHDKKTWGIRAATFFLGCVMDMAISHWFFFKAVLGATLVLERSLCADSSGNPHITESWLYTSFCSMSLMEILISPAQTRATFFLSLAFQLYVRLFNRDFLERKSLNFFGTL